MWQKNWKSLMKRNLLASVAVLSLMATPSIADDMLDAQGMKAFPDHYFYGSVFGGINFLEDQGVDIEERSSDLDEYDFGEIEFKDGFIVGGALGIDFNHMWRTEVELSYRQNDVSSYFEGTLDNDLARSGDQISAFAIMANIWHDIHFNQSVGMHIGGGVGGAIVSLDLEDIDNDDVATVDDHDWVLAAQAGVGLDWRFANGMVASLDYRAFITEELEFDGVDDDGDDFGLEMDEYLSHSIMVGLRVPFGGM